MFENFYGLTGKPFQLTPDPEFYFRSITHRKALSYLGYGLAQGEGFIVITGEVGAGKSTLVAHMVASIDPSQVTVAQVVTSKLDEEEIVHVVAQAFGLDIEGHDKASALGAIESLLHEEAREGRRCLLVVDESQNLSVKALEELRMLSNFQLGSHPLLQTMLLGQPEFRITLQSDPNLEQLRQRVIAAHHLEPMQQGEIEPYITHRLQRVGWKGNPSFDQRVFAGMFEASGGIPRRVNQIANRLLLLGAVEQRSRIDDAMLKAVLAEMEDEKALPDTSEKAPEAVAAAAAPEVAPAAPMVPGFSMEEVEKMLAARDAQIAELQQAVVELSNHQDEAIAAAVRPELQAMQEQIARLEAKSFEQERTIRQTLTMLIEWIEGEMDETKAA
ncbi:XrtA/PEP-CTERM system-associated ATPase [Alteraurantiacibacter aquimixticola]|uniref:General secretion pathway protein n=1 Tax=Alteraurantiacibacter aquimixticola TaxID=2489173 RepID=A0A4T3EYZ4_9SPHN|nr:XrtA/PEP-CTERM system-associated ATPase [Alteraurantiacibacter aquimixticola]TIX49962.1 general secretion pathway protein [Alteraurantiacibacter aquimixticola]